MVFSYLVRMFPGHIYASDQVPCTQPFKLQTDRDLRKKKKKPRKRLWKISSGEPGKKQKR